MYHQKYIVEIANLTPHHRRLIGDWLCYGNIYSRFQWQCWYALICAAKNKQVKWDNCIIFDKNRHWQCSIHAKNISEPWPQPNPLELSFIWISNVHMEFLASLSSKGWYISHNAEIKCHIYCRLENMKSLFFSLGPISVVQNVMVINLWIMGRLTQQAKTVVLSSVLIFYFYFYFFNATIGFYAFLSLYFFLPPNPSNICAR